MKMRGTRALRGVLFSLAVGSLFVGCGGDDPTGPPEPQPQPGELTVALASGTPVGGVVLTVTGPAITSPAASGGAQLYYDQSGGVLTAVVTGTSLSGEILRFTVPDVAQVAGYEVSLQEVAGTSNQSLASSGVQLSVVR
ncbi:MAG: hypothetical protein WBO43_03000 [Gemmatimonadota bacterium]|jgi:hypothetical protein